MTNKQTKTVKRSYKPVAKKTTTLVVDRFAQWCDACVHSAPSWEVDKVCRNCSLTFTKVTKGPQCEEAWLEGVIKSTRPDLEYV